MPEGISVALATYNSARFLGSQLASISQQTLLPDEVVVADDGSTDSTMDVLVAHAADEACVRVVATDRVGGVAANFARALGSASGSIIFLCDHDDIWAPEKVSHFLPRMNPEAAMLAFSDAVLIDDEGAELPRSLFETLRISKRERRAITHGRPLAVLLRRNIVTGATSALTATLRDLALPIPRGWVHDEWLAIIAAALGEVVLVDGKPTFYRQHQTNEIGLVDPTARARMRRALESAPDRHQRAYRRFSDLLARLEELGAREEALRQVKGKVRFEKARSALPGRRRMRLLPVLRLAIRGDYVRFSSQGLLDVARDLAVH